MEGVKTDVHTGIYLPKTVALHQGQMCECRSDVTACQLFGFRQRLMGPLVNEHQDLPFIHSIYHLVLSLNPNNNTN